MGVFIIQEIQKKESDTEKDLQSGEFIKKMIQQLSDNLEEFIYAVSHDLKTPLITVIGFSELLKNKFAENLPEKAKKYIERIQNNAKKLEQYLEGLLRLSRIGRNLNKQSEIMPKSDTVANIVKRSCSEYLEIAKKLRIKVEIDPEVNIPLCLNYYGIEDDLFKEIISNAIKFQYQPRNLSSELIDSKKIKFIIIKKIMAENPLFSRILSTIFNLPGRHREEKINIIYTDPILASKLNSPDSTSRVIPRDPIMLCIADNGTGIPSDSWRSTIRIFQIPKNPHSLYEKVMSQENEYIRDLFSIIPPKIGMGFPIIQKICRMTGISAAIESVSVEEVDTETRNERGTRFYLIFK